LDARAAGEREKSVRPQEKFLKKRGGEAHPLVLDEEKKNQEKTPASMRKQEWRW